MRATLVTLALLLLIAPATSASAAGDEQSLAARLRAGSLMQVHLGDSLDDFRRIYSIAPGDPSNRIRKHFWNGNLQGYRAVVSQANDPRKSWSVDAFFGLDDRLYRVVVTQLRFRIVAIDEVIDLLSPSFGAPETVFGDVSIERIAYWGDEGDAVSMMAAVARHGTDASKITVDLIDRELEARNTTAAEEAGKQNDLTF